MRRKVPMAILVGVLALGMSPPLSVAARAASPEVQNIVADIRPSAELNDKELRQRMQALRGALDQTGLADATRKELRSLLRADQAEQKTRGRQRQRHRRWRDATE